MEICGELIMLLSLYANGSNMVGVRVSTLPPIFTSDRSLLIHVQPVILFHAAYIEKKCGLVYLNCFEQCDHTVSLKRTFKICYKEVEHEKGGSSFLGQ